jgi:hypothetical protein
VVVAGMLASLGKYGGEEDGVLESAAMAKVMALPLWILETGLLRRNDVGAP